MSERGMLVFRLRKLPKCSSSSMMVIHMQAKEVRPSQKMGASAASTAAKQEQAEQRCIYAVSWQATDVPQSLPDAARPCLGQQADLANALVWKAASSWHKVTLQALRDSCQKWLRIFQTLLSSWSNPQVLVSFSAPTANNTRTSLVASSEAMQITRRC